MAFFANTQSRGTFFDPQPSFVATVRQGWQRRRRVGRIRRQLSVLTDRDLADIGIARADIDAVARQRVARG